MKKVFSLLITLAMLISTVVVPMNVSADASVWDGTADTVWDGEGTQASPYLITSAAELAGLASNVNGGNNYSGKCFKITNNIDLTNTANADWTPIGTIGNNANSFPFNGTLDGAGHVISNVKMRSSKNAMGFFGNIGSSGKVSKLGVNGVDIQFANNGDDTTVRCYQAGGFVAYLAGTVEKCYAKNVTIKNTNNAATEGSNGGFVGKSKGTLTDCYSYNVNLAGSMNCVRGGFVSSPETYDPQATNCWSANVTQEKLNSTNAFSMYGFGKERVRSTGEPGAYGSNCYTTAANDPTDLTNAICATTTKGALIAGIVTDGSSFVLNKGVESINDGYPVLAWEDKGIWDGTSADDSWKTTGTGAASNPYKISTADQLANLASAIFNADSTYVTATNPAVPVVKVTDNIYEAYTGSYFELTADIDLANTPWVPIGRYGMRFNGVFNGNGHVVKNLKIGAKGTGTYFAQGLFGAISDEAVIRNLGVQNATIVFSNQDTLKDYNANGDLSLQGGSNKRTNGTGGLVGICGESTIESCYVKNVNINNTNSGITAYNAGGMIGYAEKTDTATSLNDAKVKCTNCYVLDATIKGNFNNSKALFIGHNQRINTDTARVLYDFNNCYVGGNIPADNTVCEFAGSKGLNASGNMSNCFTTATGCKEQAFGQTCYVLTKTDKAGIEKALVTGNNVWNLDSVKNLINGGYPVLGWEKTWTVDDDPMAFYKGTGVVVEDGKVTKVTVVQSDSTVNGEVVVAVYNGERFESATTVAAANGTITLTTPLAVNAGNTVKVFVWNSIDGLVPLGFEYITTVEPSYLVEDGVMTVEYAGVLPDNLEFEDIPEETIASVKKIVIDDGVTGIGDNIFSEFTSIESVEIPRTVETISDTAFPNTDFTIYGCANGAAEAYADANNKEFMLKELRILTIGNSHTSDHGRWNAEIWGDVADAGIETEIVYERIINSSHGMYYSASTDSAGYAISHYVQAHNPSSVNYSKYAKLVDEEWDLVLIQDYRESCVGIEGFTDAMAETTKWLRAAQPKAKIGWIVDWNDRTDSKDNAVLQQKFYDKTVTTVNNVLAMTSDAPDYIIPMGTAMQNARATYLGSVMNAAGCCVNEGYTMGKETNYNVLERDNTHLSLELGRYMMGAAVFGYIYDLYQDKLIGGDTVDFCDSLVTMPVEAGANEWKGEFTDSIWDIVEEVTENTIANPWTITNSVYTVDPAIAKAVEVENATYTDFTPAGIVATIKTLGNGFTVSESDVTIDGDTATVKFLYGYSEKTVTIKK